MGACSCFRDKVQPVDEQSTLARTSSGDSSEPSTKKPRKITDVFFLLAMTLFLTILVAFIIYCVCYGDIYRLLNGYDSCANVCGRQNYRETDIKFTCKGIDMKEKRLLLIRNAAGKEVDPNAVGRECVDSCRTGYKEYLNRCVPAKTSATDSSTVNTIFSKVGLSNFFQEAAEDLDICSNELIYLSLIALAFSIIILILFRFFVGFVVWLVLFGVVIGTIVGTIYCWILYANSNKSMETTDANLVSEVDSRRKSSLLALAIIVTVVAVAVTLLVIVMRKRIMLTVQLFREAGRAINAMPLLLIEPLITFVALGVIIVLWIYFCLLIQSAGRLTYVRDSQFEFEMDDVMRATRWMNLFAGFWMVQFVIGCEYMVIAGAVATWYFTRDKSHLGYPILYAWSNLVRYHLGSVAVGSLIIAVIQMLRVLLGIVQKYLTTQSDAKCMQALAKCCACCMMCFEKVLKFINRNAYIEIAMYGYPFCTAGRQAFQLLANNALRVAVINSVGDFVLIMGKVLVVLATALIGVKMLEDKEGIHHVWVPIALVAIFAYFVSHCFLSVYEMAIDTIFLCFCEDSEQNDGESKPYFMSKGLMDFVANSRRAFAYAEKSVAPNTAWGTQSPPYTISNKVD